MVARITDSGFVWEQVAVERMAQFERANGVYRVIRINDLNVYISPTGRTRVFRAGVGELVLPTSASENEESSEADSVVAEQPRSRPKRKCGVCGRMICQTKTGRLYLHGANGMGFFCKGL